VDMFHFEAPGTNVLILRQEATESPLNVLLTVFDGKYQQLAQNDTADRTATFNAVAGESYYVRLTAAPFAAPGADTGSFAFSVVPQFLDGEFFNLNEHRPVQAEGTLS